MRLAFLMALCVLVGTHIEALWPDRDRVSDRRYHITFLAFESLGAIGYAWAHGMYRRTQ